MKNQRLRAEHKINQKIAELKITTLSPYEIGSWEQLDIKGAFQEDVIPFSKNLKETFKLFKKGSINEVKEMKDILKQMENEVDQCSMEKKYFEIEKKQLLINNDRLLKENISCDIMCTYLRSLNEVDNSEKCQSLDIVLLDLQESNKSLRVSSTNTSRSKPRSNTKNDMIQRTSSRSKKNKVQAQLRKSKSSFNKNNHVSDCNANAKNVALIKNSTNICLSCNELEFFDLWKLDSPLDIVVEGLMLNVQNEGSICKFHFGYAVTDVEGYGVIMLMWTSIIQDKNRLQRNHNAMVAP
ncbi:hypothetical protein Tco_1144009 [Tanacetum coccineum]